MKPSEFRKLIREEVRKVILEANGTSELVLYTYDDSYMNKWTDYDSLVKAYPIVQKLPKEFVKKYLTLKYLSSVRRHKLNTLEKLIAKEFKKVGIDVELGEGDDTTIEMYFEH